MHRTPAARRSFHTLESSASDSLPMVVVGGGRSPRSPKEESHAKDCKGLKLGFLFNFGSNLMKDGFERIVNGLPEENLGVFVFA